MKTNHSAEEITSENIALAIGWYQANQSELRSFLPFETPGVTFKKGWIIRLESMICLWASEKLALYLAEIYIHRPLRLIVQGMKSAAKAEHSS